MSVYQKFLTLSCRLKHGARESVKLVPAIAIAALASVSSTIATAYETTIFHAEAVNIAMPVSTRADAPVILGVDAFDRHFDLELMSNDALLENMDSASIAGISLYRGQIVGVDNSWVRISSINGRLSGVVHDGNELFLIDQVTSLESAVSPALFEELSASGAQNAMFRAEDVVTTALCGAGPAHSNIVGEGGTLGDMVREFSEMAAPDQSITVKVVFDEALKQFAEGRGSTAQAQSISHLNIVDGIFSNQVGVKILLTPLVQIPGSDIGGIDARTYLGEFRQYIINTGNAGIAHLFTGREMDSNVAGIAYVGAICNDNFGVGLSEVGKASRVPTVGGLIAGHEIGHNFGAPHDNQGGSACSATPGNFLMNPSINGSDQFSPCSLTQMANTISNQGSCLAPYGGGNQAPVLDSIGDQTNDIGDSVSVTATATDADNDALTFSATGLPTGVSMSNDGNITGTANADGVFQTVVTVTDGQASDSESLTWTVNGPSNRAPVIEPIADQTNVEGDSVNLATRASDPDNDDLTFSSSGLPTGLSVDATSGVITGTATAAGQYNAVVTVSDGTASDSSSFTWTVTEDTNPGDIVVNVPAAGVRVTEDNVSASVNVTLSRAAASPVSVIAFSRIDTATPGSDYYGFTTTVTFAAGETSKTVDVQILDDTAEEPAETLQVVLTSASGAVIGNGTSPVTIIDDDSGDDAPAYFNISDVKVAEDAGSAEITISLSKALSDSSSVSVATAPDTAKNGADYYGLFTTVEFAAGETQMKISVPILNDSEGEDDEVIKTRLFSPSSNARVGDGEGTITIEDDEGV